MFAANHTSNNNKTLPQIDASAVYEDDSGPKFAPMTADDLNNTTTGKSHPNPPSNYQLTFFVDNDTNSDHLQLTDFTNFHLNNNKEAIVMDKQDEHQTFCLLSAFLYFVTITSFVYLAILWIKQRIHVHVEQMQWW